MSRCDSFLSYTFLSDIFCLALDLYYEGIAPFTFACSFTVQILFMLFAFIKPVPADLTAIPALSGERTIANYRSEVNLLLMPMPFIPTLGESLDLAHIVTHPIDIGAA